VKKNLKPAGNGAEIVTIDEYFRPNTEKTWKDIVTTISIEEATLRGLTQQSIAKSMASR
jgi:hypothetical protein